MKNEGLDKLKNEAVNALVRWGKIGLGLYSMRDAVNAYMKARIRAIIIVHRFFYIS